MFEDRKTVYVLGLLVFSTLFWGVGELQVDGWMHCTAAQTFRLW